MSYSGLYMHMIVLISLVGFLALLLVLLTFTSTNQGVYYSLLLPRTTPCLLLPTTTRLFLLLLPHSLLYFSWLWLLPQDRTQIFDYFKPPDWVYSDSQCLGLGRFSYGLLWLTYVEKSQSILSIYREGRYSMYVWLFWWTSWLEDH